MADLNVWSGTGRLTRDAENKTLPTGTQLVTFDIANNTGWGQYARVAYLKVNVWGKQGQSLLQYLIKGKCVAVSGELQVEQWNQQDGTPRSKNVINANSVILMADRVQNRQGPEPGADLAENDGYNESADIPY
jgi:single-strand DNA-binding protein